MSRMIVVKRGVTPYDIVQFATGAPASLDKTYRFPAYHGTCQRLHIGGHLSISVLFVR